jgi:hypothetical protein
MYAGMSQQTTARVAGAMYLLVLAAALFASFYVRASLIVWGDVGATAGNIAGSELLFRLGLASDLVSFAGIVVLALALYLLLKPVNRTLALLGLCWWLGEAFILALNTLNDYIVLILLSGADYLSVFDAAQLQALVRVFLEAHLTGYNIGLIFFALGSVIFSYLFYSSKYIPRVLSGWGIFASVLFLAGTFVILVEPSYEGIAYQFINPPIALFELAIGAWLLIKGVRIA